MTSIVGRGVRVEIGLTYGAPVTVSAITQADPGVATAAAHAQANKTVGYLSSVEGMVNLEGQAVRVANQATNTFELEDIKTTNLAAFTGTALFTPVATWATLGRITGYNSGGGEAEKLDDTVLLDDIKQELNGLLAAQSVSLPLNAMTISDSAMRLVRTTARDSEYLVFRITLKDGNVRVFRGQPSLPGEDVQKGAIGTGTFTVTVKGFICEGAA
jgi:hypothetical protein